MEIIRRKTDYGIRALIHMAKKKAGTKFPAADIASSQGIPEEYLYKIFQKLIKGGLIKATRGPRGGFTLAKDPRKVSIGQVIEILQSPVTVNRCFLEQKKCDQASRCKLKNEWSRIQHDIEKMLDEMTLADLASQSQEEVKDESFKKNRADR